MATTLVDNMPYGENKLVVPEEVEALVPEEAGMPTAMLTLSPSPQKAGGEVEPTTCTGPLQEDLAKHGGPKTGDKPAATGKPKGYAKRAGKRKQVVMQRYQKLGRDYGCHLRNKRATAGAAAAAGFGSMNATEVQAVRRTTPKASSTSGPAVQAFLAITEEGEAVEDENTTVEKNKRKAESEVPELVPREPAVVNDNELEATGIMLEMVPELHAGEAVPDGEEPAEQQLQEGEVIAKQPEAAGNIPPILGEVAEEHDKPGSDEVAPGVVPKDGFLQKTQEQEQAKKIPADEEKTRAKDDDVEGKHGFLQREGQGNKQAVASGDTSALYSSACIECVCKAYQEARAADAGLLPRTTKWRSTPFLKAFADAATDSAGCVEKCPESTTTLKKPLTDLQGLGFTPNSLNPKNWVGNPFFRRKLRAELRSVLGGACGGGHTITVTYSDGRKYTGKVDERGEPTGDSGKMVWQDGLEFVGNFKDGQPHGKGTMSMPDLENEGGRKEKEGDDWGYGEIKYPSGSSYVGHHVGMRYGNGTTKLKYGRGTYTFTDGKSAYEGQWWDDEFNGEGTYTHANGDRYEGQLTGNQKNGKGTFEWALLGKVYVGQWKGDKVQGEGKLTWNSGEMYEGQWHDNKRDGKGVMTWSPNSAAKVGNFVGTWVNDMISGEGILTCNNAKKTTHDGNWKTEEGRTFLVSGENGAHGGDLLELCKEPASSQ
ncbi:unnamed protein product [Amoebophrya sp. A120]|nr:unnamed protein product [Amoebophrya sp. A120]|eukprot:GSA120T00020742001.1